ncbi:MAG TPA: hypothetical protein VFJ03_07370 [Candidatus Limnocylindria bacterium]|nr:hypothetical protein [Candidatus Limnocylindria bacterium]
MAILAPLLAFIGQFLGKFLNMAFSWASVMLFGRVPASKQLLLSGISLGAIAWLAVLIGVLLPTVGTFLLAFVPLPDWVDEGWVRVAMLVAAVVLPLLIGIGGLFLVERGARPSGGQRVIAVLRGYPYAAVLALVLVTMVIVAPVRKVRSIIKRWEDQHMPVVIQPDGYDEVAADLESALDGAGMEIGRARAPWILELPSRLLAAVGGTSVRRLVPDQLFVLQNRSLEVTLHPADVVMSGRREYVARARAAIATRMTFTAAYMTSAKESQQVEDVLRAISKGQAPGGALAAVDERLATLTIPHEEWEVLYRQRLQVERDLRRAADRRDHGPRDSVPLLAGLCRWLSGARTPTE